VTTIDQRHWAAMAVQHALVGLSDKPRQFSEPPLVGIFEQAHRAWREERFGDSGGMKTVPF
jgi:hypothetical protein